MSIHKLLIKAITATGAVLVFFFLNNYLSAFTFFSPVISFSVVVILLFVFQEPIQRFLKKIVATQYFFKIGKNHGILESLNYELNKAIRFHEVTKILFNSFQLLFGKIPYAFYIIDAGKFCLEKSNLIEDEELLALDIDGKLLAELPITESDLDLKNSGIPKNIIKKMKSAGLTSIIPLPGRLGLFAFLLINPRHYPFRSEKESVTLFNKIREKAGVVLENSALFVDLEQKNRDVRNLIKISDQILSSLDIKTILDFILSTCKTVANYDASAIYLLDKSGKQLLRTSSVGYAGEELDKLHLKVGQGSCGWVAQTKEIDILDDVRTSQQYFQLRKETRSQLSVPLIHNQEVIGVLCLESNRLAFFNEGLVEILKLFAKLAAIAIFNASQIDAIVTKRALEIELINAGKVQEKLLIQRFPSTEKFKMTAFNIPSKIVSGDLYDIIRYSPTSLGVAIGDVSGKGAAAALMMSLILAGLRSHKKTFLNACDITYRLNNLLSESTIEGKYATFFYAVFALHQNKIIYTNAGHNPPVFIKANGEISRLTKGGVVLGYISDWEYEQDEIAWEPGDLFVAFTDGVTETMNAQDEEFGEDRLIEIIAQNHQLPIYQLKNSIISALNDFSGTETPEDDLTLVICKNE